MILLHHWHCICLSLVLRLISLVAFAVVGVMQHGQKQFQSTEDPTAQWHLPSHDWVAQHLDHCICGALWHTPLPSKSSKWVVKHCCIAKGNKNWNVELFLLLINGSSPCIQWPDIKTFWHALMGSLEAGRKVEADLGYWGPKLHINEVKFFSVRGINSRSY